MIRAHLSRPNFGSAIRAALIGVPMPLCSCGVVPTAMGLHKQGASRGATMSFLISTPSTGVDSVLVSAAFLGWPFALFKVGAAFVTGVFGGWLTNWVTRRDRVNGQDAEQSQPYTVKGNRMLAALRYAVFDILGAIDLWLIGGILLAALITTLIPTGSLADIAWTQGLGGMLLVLAIALPLYVCNTASVPIAASLIAAGMPTGTALVFLMAGPATNIATMGIVFRTLGARLLAVYLGTVIVASIGFGMTFDFVIGSQAVSNPPHAHEGAAWWQVLSAAILIGLLAYLLARRFGKRQAGGDITPGAHDIALQVSGMTCPNCASSVKSALEAVDDVDAAIVDFGSGIVRVQGGKLRRELLHAAVTRAGFSVVDVPSDAPTPGNHL
jgi:uncharacterized membrane protein YraQ (UPF0718 family)/copper chaperone CopZ